MSQIYAVGICRVSSDEQLKNNSLNRQQANVRKAAAELNVILPDEYMIAGSVSSKRGTNLNRPDLKKAYEICKKDKRVKFLIVDEPDRFMRAIREAAYHEESFASVGVTVWYASDPELNTNGMTSELLKFTKYMAAQGSNEERQRKSISGQTKALEEGRYPFHPKPGYRRGYVKGIPEIDEFRAPALKAVLEKISASMLTPTQALKELNQSDFVKGRVPYRMDKFRKIATDPFYAGIVEVNKQVKVRNPNGVYEPLITLAMHRRILQIFSNKPKNQTGPLKNGNPKYPCNNIVFCDKCNDKPNNRVVGFDHTNGKPNSKVYERYRCRGCGTYLARDELHSMVIQQLNANAISVDGTKLLLVSLKTVWRQKEGDLQQEKTRIEHKLTALNAAIAKRVEAAIEPSNATIKDDIMESIARSKQEVSELENRLDMLQTSSAAEEKQFLQFALAWIKNISDNFLASSLPRENRLRCKQIIFPAGFRLNKKQKVYTPEISPLITLVTNKKDLPETEKSSMVRVRRL